MQKSRYVTGRSNVVYTTALRRALHFVGVFVACVGGVVALAILVPFIIIGGLLVLAGDYYGKG